MKKTVARLALGVSAIALAPIAATAQQAPNGSTDPAVATGPVDAQADPSTAADAAQTDAAAPDVVVLGFGRSRQVQTVTAFDLTRMTPGTSPLKAIAKLPGVNFQAADPFGAYEWAVRISIRGFNQNQLGFTLDDVPLGDMSYGNENGLHISRAIISENLGRAEVAQGAGALATASTGNLGGTLQFYSSAPRDRAGVDVSGTYGSDDTYRGYVRLDTGDITGGGLRAYLSYAYLTTDKWKGYGPQRQHQANAKVVQDLGTLGSISAFFNYSARRETDYQDLTLDLFNRLGRDRAYYIDNIRPNYTLAKQIAAAYQNGTAFPAPYQNVDDVYYDAGGLRNDYLAGTTFDAHLAPGLTFKATGYYHENRGQGSWITPYAVTPAGAPDASGNPIVNPANLAFRTTEYGIHRGGVVTDLTYETGANTIAIGGWYESNSFDQARRFYGLGATAPGRETLAFQNNPFFTQYQGKYDTETALYHVADTLKLLNDALVLNGGWKGYKVINRGRVTVGALAGGRIDATDWFLPQVGAVLHVGPKAELFADYTENMRAFVSALTGGPFSTTQAGFNALLGRLKPETSRTYEGGVRFHQGAFQASAVGYYVNFENRLAAFANGSGIVGNPAILNNVGSVHTYGGEVTANYRLLHDVSLFANYSYNHSKYRDDVVNSNGSIYAYTAGKFVVDAPEHMAKAEIVYDDDTFFVRANGDYQSKRYFSYENDLVAAGRFLANASIGYRFSGFTAEFNVTNLTDKRYIATVNTNNVQVRGYTNTPNSGRVNGAGFDTDNPNFMVGAPRQYFVSLKKQF